MKNGLIMIQSNGNKYWLKNDKFHREDGPAVGTSENDYELLT